MILAHLCRFRLRLFLEASAAARRRDDTAATCRFDAFLAACRREEATAASCSLTDFACVLLAAMAAACRSAYSLTEKMAITIRRILRKMSHQCQLRNFLILKPHPFVNSLPEMSVSKLGGRCKGEVCNVQIFRPVNAEPNKSKQKYRTMTIKQSLVGTFEVNPSSTFNFYQRKHSSSFTTSKRLVALPHNHSKLSCIIN